MFKSSILILIAFVCQLSITSSAADQNGAKDQVLLIDGQNNHDWIEMPVMMDTSTSDRFSIGPLSHVLRLINLIPTSKYDVVLSNYNGLPWKKQRNLLSNISRKVAASSSFMPQITLQVERV